MLVKGATVVVPYLSRGRDPDGVSLLPPERVEVTAPFTDPEYGVMVSIVHIVVQDTIRLGV